MVTGERKAKCDVSAVCKYGLTSMFRVIGMYHTGSCEDSNAVMRCLCIYQSGFVRRHLSSLVAASWNSK